MTTVIVFAEALRKSEPVGQERHDPEKLVCCRALSLKTDTLPIYEVFLLVVASDGEEMLERGSHRGDDIGKEEVPEADFAKGCN